MHCTDMQTRQTRDPSDQEVCTVMADTLGAPMDNVGNTHEG